MVHYHTEENYLFEAEGDIIVSWYSSYPIVFLLVQQFLVVFIVLGTEKMYHETRCRTSRRDSLWSCTGKRDTIDRQIWVTCIHLGQRRSISQFEKHEKRR